MSSCQLVTGICIVFLWPVPSGLASDRKKLAFLQLICFSITWSRLFSRYADGKHYRSVDHSVMSASCSCPSPSAKSSQYTSSARASRLTHAVVTRHKIFTGQRRRKSFHDIDEHGRSRPFHYWQTSAATLLFLAPVETFVARRKPRFHTSRLPDTKVHASARTRQWRDNPGASLFRSRRNTSVAYKCARLPISNN